VPKRTSQLPIRYTLARKTHKSAPCAFRALLRNETSMTYKPPVAHPSTTVQLVYEPSKQTNPAAPVAGQAQAAPKPHTHSDDRPPAQSPTNHDAKFLDISAEDTPAPEPQFTEPETDSCTQDKTPRRRGRNEPRLTSLAMHQAHCLVCRYDVRKVIDQAFVNWECVYKIAREYNIPARSIYRHAHATKLFAKRDRNIRGALSHLIHEADRTEPTAESIVSAVKVFAHINSRGEWVNPPTQVVYTAAPPARRGEQRRQSRKNQPRRPAKRATGRKRSKSRKAASPARKLLDTRRRANKRSTR
jgi:hypothetical protein